MSIAIAVVSGGMDSSTLAHKVKYDVADEVHGIGFDYGQRHKKELSFALSLVDDSILASYRVVDLTNLQDLLGASVLTDLAREVPDGHYAEENMKQTVVPNRNRIMRSIAVGYAVTLEATRGVWTGVHAGDHFIYPDCRENFILLANETAIRANEGFLEVDKDVSMINAPFIKMGKHDIAGLGHQYHVDYSKTWSCYKGGDIHCGSCGTCVERKEAFRLSQTPDPTSYLDPHYEIEAYRG
jgi:7-cyano-7-deazaguanine synthase